jgi:hypothetical protein
MVDMRAHSRFEAFDGNHVEVVSAAAAAATAAVTG